MRNPLKSAILAAAILAALPAGAAEILFPNADFETGTLANWTAVGTAFTRQPTFVDNTTARGNVAALQQGSYWIGTFENYDGITGSPGASRGGTPAGTLTSPDFTIVKRYITCRVGGGNLPGQTGVKLFCEGVDHVISTSFDTESMFPVTFDAAALTGKTAHLVIYDQATGGWGLSGPSPEAVWADTDRWKNEPLMAGRPWLSPWGLLGREIRGSYP